MADWMMQEDGPVSWKTEERESLSPERKEGMRAVWESLGHHQGPWCSPYRGTRTRRVKRPEEMLEGLTAGNFPNRGKGAASQVQAARRVLCREEYTTTHGDQNDNSLKHRTLRGTREKQQITYWCRETPRRPPARFSAENEGQREVAWHT